MLSNKTYSEKNDTVLLAHAALLLVMSLLVAVQGVFEIIDYMPHIISAGCVNCAAYAASIPTTLIMYIWFCYRRQFTITEIQKKCSGLSLSPALSE